MAQQSQPTSAMTDAEFLLKHQDEWTSEEKLARFLAFLDKHRFNIFDLEKTLQQVPHKVLNIEFKFYSNQRLDLGSRYSMTTQSLTPNKIIFRNRQWQNVQDIAHDVLLWNMLVGSFTLDNAGRTAFWPRTFIRNYREDFRFIYTGIDDLINRLYAQKLIEAKNLEILRELKQIEVLEQRGQEACEIKSKGVCRLWGKWAWQNYIRFVAAFGIATSAITTGAMLVDTNFNKAAQLYYKVQTEGYQSVAKEAFKDVKLQAPTKETVCEVAQEDLAGQRQTIENLEKRYPRTEQEERQLAIERAVEIGLKKAYPQCQ